jgi:uncharacterized protein
MDWESADLLQCTFLALVVTMAFAVRGATGFGSGLVAVPLAALALPVQVVIPVINSLQLFSNAEYSARNWRRVVWREILRIVPFAAVGVLVGLYLFLTLDARVIAKGLGLFVIAYAIHAMATASRKEAPAPKAPPWPVTASLNAGGGLLGALFGGAASPFFVVYLRTLRLHRDAFRATMTMIILVQVVLRSAGYAGMGFLNAKILLISTLVLPFMFIGARLGDVIANHIAPQTFNRLVGALLLVSGTALVLR